MKKEKIITLKNGVTATVIPSKQPKTRYWWIKVSYNAKTPEKALKEFSKELLYLKNWKRNAITIEPYI